MTELSYGIFDIDLFKNSYCDSKLKILMIAACLVAIKSSRRLEIFEIALTKGASQEELIEATSIGFLMGSSQLIQSYKSTLYISIKKHLKEEINPECIDDFFCLKNPSVQNGFSEFYNAVYSSNELNAKDKELIAVAVSVVLKCNTCQESHITKAYNFNASPNEINEAEKIGKYVLASEVLSIAEYI